MFLPTTLTTSANTIYTYQIKTPEMQRVSAGYHSLQGEYGHSPWVDTDISSNLINNYNFNHFSQHNTYQIKTPEMQWVSAGHSLQGEYGHSPWVDTDISSNLINNITLPTT